MNNELGGTLWPEVGEWLRYIMSDTIPDYYVEPKLTHNNEYRVEAVSFVTCYDRVKVIDDEGHLHWVPLHKFSFLDQMEYFNDGR